VHCTRTITLYILILELLPFVTVHTVLLSQTCWGYISKTITDLNMKLRGNIDLIVTVHTVLLSQTCWGYISKTITDLNMKLRGNIDLMKENHNPPLPNFRVIALCYFSYYPSITDLFGLYLKDYYRFEHQTSGVYRFCWGEVHCTRTITLHLLILELLPFVNFDTWILWGTYLSDYKLHETLYVDRPKWVEVYCTWAITLHIHILEVLLFAFYT